MSLQPWDYTSHPVCDKFLPSGQAEVNPRSGTIHLLSKECHDSVNNGARIRCARKRTPAPESRFSLANTIPALKPITRVNNPIYYQILNSRSLTHFFKPITRGAGATTYFTNRTVPQCSGMCILISYCGDHTQFSSGKGRPH